MTKVVCPHCGLVNLDRFVSFPHCAGCGSLLSVHVVRVAPSWWQRPLRASLWATIVGLGCAALALAFISITQETRLTDEAHLIVYPQVPRVVALGDTLNTQFQLDSVAASEPDAFDDARLRLPRALLAEFTVVAVAPPPQAELVTRGGRYLVYNHLARETPISLALSPRRIGQFSFVVQLYAKGYYPFEIRNFVTVTRPGGKHVAP
jgi:hypothetical protein